MCDVDSLEGHEILAMTKPEQLYSSSPSYAKIENRRLRSKWGPEGLFDERVLAKVQELFELAIERYESGSWDNDRKITIRTKDDRKFDVDYLKKFRFEMGEVYLTERNVVYVVDKEYGDFVHGARRVVEGLRYPNQDLRDEFSRFVPYEREFGETRDGRFVLAYAKTPNLIRLRDVLDHFGGRIEPRHVAWMVSRMYGLATYLNTTKVAHCHISPDTLFVDPKARSLALLGGWWYSSDYGSAIDVVPTRTVEHVFGGRALSVRSNAKIDPKLVKVTGLELLGECEAPGAMLRWLRAETGHTAFDDFNVWFRRVLPESFGARPFEEFEVSVGDVY